jgi:hypothetical protein
MSLVPGRFMKSTKLSMVRLACAFALTAVLSLFAVPTLAKTISVNCDLPGRTLAQAITIASPGDTIEVSGTCNERVTFSSQTGLPPTSVAWPLPESVPCWPAV